MSTPIGSPLGSTTPTALPSLGTSPAGATDWRSKGFDFAADGTKQLITVATGVITAAVIFSKDINPAARWWALGAWGLLTVSVLCGIFVLLSMSGHLTQTANTTAPSTAIAVDIKNPDTWALPNLYGKGIRRLSIAQCMSFLAGLAVMSVFGFEAVANPVADPKPAPIECRVVLTTPPAPQPAAVASAPSNDTPKAPVRRQHKPKTN
jgi:hypothetical protein